MNGRFAQALLWAGLLPLFAGALFAEEPWVYRYGGGTGLGTDRARSIVIGSDGNLYAGGMTYQGIESYHDFTVVSLTPSGAERWVYLYESPRRNETVNSIVMGSDGNLYAAGCSQG